MSENLNTFFQIFTAPPKYDELPPSYHDAIRLHLTDLQPNTVPDLSVQEIFQTSSCERLVSHTNSDQYQNTHSNQQFGATCSNDTCSDSESVFSSQDSLISFEEAEMENFKSQEVNENDLIFQGPFMRRPAQQPLRTCAEDLRIAVLRRNLARAREELPMIMDQSSTDSATTPNCAKSRKPLAAIINSILTVFPFVCQDMKS